MSQTILMYSESGLGKTSNVGQFARYQYARTGHPVRLVTCDSGFGPCQPEVDEGMIIPLRLESCPHPVPVLNKISKGEWPIDSIDAKEGLWKLAPGARFEHVASPSLTGGYAIEGLTRICELVRKAWTDEQRNIGEPLQGQFEQMGEQFSFQSRGTLFAIQQLINNVVINFRSLPVDRVLWTAHESKGKDLMGATVLGPATTGQALTDKIAGWFEIVLHHDSYQYQEQSRDGLRMLTKTAMRAWFQRHPDADYNKMYWPAKLGLSPQLTGAMYEYFEEGFFPLILDMRMGKYVQGLHTFLSIIDNGGRLPGVEQLAEQPIPIEPMIDDLALEALKAQVDGTVKVLETASLMGETKKAGKGKK